MKWASTFKTPMERVPRPKSTRLRLIDAVSKEVDRISHLPGQGATDDNAMSILLEVATRNDDANYALLTGEYPEGVDVPLPWDGPSADGNRENALVHLYTHDWGTMGQRCARSLIGLRMGLLMGMTILKDIAARMHWKR